MRGSHGTCKTFAQSIQQDGFQPGTGGQLGKGIYFWIHSDSASGENLGRKLSKAWFDFALKKEHYRDATDKNCAFVFVDLEIDGDSALDFDDVDVSANLSEFYEYAVGRFPTLGREELSCICDEFIALMEEARESKYDVILGMVDVPHDRLPDADYLRFRRRSRCASVQNRCIAKILKIEELQES